MKYSWCILLPALALPLSALAANARPAAEPPSPDNQVFQFSHTATCSAWSDGSKNTATAYLWIPENCKTLRGLLILCNNVPEHRLAGHPDIRRVCVANDLGIVWCNPTFMNFARQQPGKNKMTNEYATIVAFLQQLLDGLAKTSGYGEVAAVPWLPMGESGHLLMVDALVEARPDRCLAGIWIKNNHLPPKNRQTPAMVVFGTAQEWGQDKTDIRTRWNDVEKAYAGILNERRKNPDWPLSYIIDGQSGHFDCSDRLTGYFARYIDLVCKARLCNDGSPGLKSVAPNQGFLADLPVPGHESQSVKPAKAPDALPWYFDETSAREAQSFAAINWKAQSQFPGLLGDDGKFLPYDFNGIMDLKSVKLEQDGLTFGLTAAMHKTIPPGFPAAGDPLAQTTGELEYEWLCGSVWPLGGNRFRFSPGRGSGPIYLAIRKTGNDAVRGVVQPIHIEPRLFRNDEGTPQTLTFEKIPDVKAGAESVALSAKSDAGLPVGFYVEVGPAVIKDGRLIFTKIPPRSRLPIEVTVAAWQMGRSTAPKVKTAEIVKQTFRIVAP